MAMTSELSTSLHKVSRSGLACWLLVAKLGATCPLFVGFATAAYVLGFASSGRNGDRKHGECGNRNERRERCSPNPRITHHYHIPETFAYVNILLAEVSTPFQNLEISFSRLPRMQLDEIINLSSLDSRYSIRDGNIFF